MKENNEVDKKSLRSITKVNVDWNELAKDCVCFANAYGGKLLIGIEDDDDLPPENQKIPSDLPVKLQKQIQNRTINVSVIPSIKTAENNGQYIDLIIRRNASSIACTSNGKYFIRVDDECNPVLPDELQRLLNDKSAFQWETQVYLKIPRSIHDEPKLNNFYQEVKNSERVSEFVKSKSKEELLDHYLFADDKYLTNLGILWIGKREHRARLLYSPVVQFIKWDENEQKVRKQIWDDYSFNPKELIEAVWSEIPDWRDGIEITDGIFRKNLRNYDEVVVRELLANALVHRPYTTRGDIFINLFNDRFEIHNPGLLPLGVTPKNILHKSVQRNPHLAKVFYDLKLMEKEGSGYDKIYESLLSSGKPLPQTIEGEDRVLVKVEKRIVNKDVIHFIDKVNKSYQLRSKEIISLGLIAQNKALTAIDFGNILSLKEKDAVQNWMGRLIEFGLVELKGRTKGATYFIKPEILKKHKFTGKTTLRNIEPYRIKELIKEDLKTYSNSSISEINNRIGNEIPRRTIRYVLNKLIAENEIGYKGERKWRRYFIDKSAGNK